MKTDNKRRCGIGDIPHFERNNYFYGKLLTKDDFLAEQCYFNEKRWLINRTILGWGVVCGLDVVSVKNDPSKVLVKPGLAIDCCGREILVCEEKVVQLTPEEAECQRQEKTKESGAQKYFVCLEFRECMTESLPTHPIACDQEQRCQFNKIRDGFNIRVVPAWDDTCSMPHFCPMERGEDKIKPLHQYLCEQLKEGCPKCPKCYCVILASVTSDSKSCEIDLCSGRRLVYGNPVLYNLINCFHGDLPHIMQINWGHKKHYDWEGLVGVLKGGLKVTFNTQMQSETINLHTFLLAVIKEDEATGYRIMKYIPAEKIETQDSEDPNGKPCTMQVTFIVEEGWIDDELDGAHSELRYGAQFEVILRGSSIMSIGGKALDGDFIGGNCPSGNGTQGGDFVSWFSVEPKPIAEDEASKKKKR